MTDVVINIEARDNFSGVLGNFGGIITGIESAINLVGQAFDAATGLITPFINSASESEQAVARLEGVLAATGGAAGASSQELQDLAGALQGVTRFSDETILTGAAVLLTFRNISEETLMRTIPSMLDMAEIFGSVDSAAMQLGKALNDPVSMMGALSRAGVTFSDAQKEMIKNFVETGDIASAQNIILSEVEAQVGSLAEAMGQTFSGQVAIALNKLDEFRELLGGPVIALLTDLLSTFSDFASQPQVVNFFNDLAVSIGEFLLSLELVDRLENFLGLIATAMQTGNWQPVWDSIVTTFETIKTKIIELFSGAGGIDIAGKIQGLVDMLAVAIEQANWTAVTHTLADIIGGALRIALEGLDIIVNQVDWRPLGVALTGAIGEIGRGLSETIGRDIVEGLVAGIQTALLVAREAVSAPFRGVIATIKGIFGIASPSTVFMDIGRDIVMGLVAGIGSLAGWASNAIAGIVDTILAPFGIVADLLGIGGIGGSTGDATGTLGTGGVVGGRDMGGVSTGASGTTVNQYFAGATINVGSWDEIIYDCVYPNPFVAATSGQLGSFGNNTGLNGGGV